MFIGYLENYKLESFRAGTNIPLESEGAEPPAIMRWDYRRILNTSLDLRFTLPHECFVGSISFTVQGYTKIYSAKVIGKSGVLGEYHAETGKYFTTDFTITVGQSLTEFTVRINNAYSTIEFTDIKIAGAYEDGAPLIWPTPKSIKMGEGSVIPGKIISSEHPDALYAASFLSESIAERFGNIQSEDGVPVELIIDKSYPDEKITVCISECGAKITAKTRLTLLRGATMLLSLIEDGKIKKCEISDTPSFQMRGFHMGIPKRENLEFAKRLFRYVLLPLGYNQLFIQLCGGMRYESHPKISEAWLASNELAREGKAPPFPHDYMGAEGTLLEKDEVRDLFDYARALGFELIPEVQSLGHVQWITNAYPEIGEVDPNEKQVEDERAEDLRPDKKFIHCYCPSNEKSYKIIFDIIDETIEVIRPQRFVHIGHDEVYHLGLCEKCRKKTHAELFAEDVMKLYNHIKSHGLRTMMWSDMLQPVSKYETKPAINILPRDIVMLDFIWYFHFDKDIEENLTEAGFKVLFGNLYSSHYPRYASRAKNPGVIGGQLSSWCALSEYAMGKKGKFWDLTYTAELLSNPEKYSDDMRPVYSKIIAEHIQPLQRDLIRGKHSPTGYTRKRVAMPQKSDTSLPEALIKERRSATVADGIVVEINAKFDRIAIECATLQHGLRTPWQPLTVCGDFLISYADGESVIVPAEYAGGVQHINHRYGEPFPEPAHRHTGYFGTWFADPTLYATSKDGTPIALTELIFENPKPDVKINSISYKSREDDMTTLVITGITGLIKN